MFFSFYTEQEQLIIQQLSDLLNNFKKETEFFLESNNKGLNINSSISDDSIEMHINNLNIFFERQTEQAKFKINILKNNHTDELDLKEFITNFLEELTENQEEYKEEQLLFLQNKNNEKNIINFIELRTKSFLKSLNKKINKYSKQKEDLVKRDFEIQEQLLITIQKNSKHLELQNEKRRKIMQSIETSIRENIIEEAEYEIMEIHVNIIEFDLFPEISLITDDTDILFNFLNKSSYLFNNKDMKKSNKLIKNTINSIIDDDAAQMITFNLNLPYMTTTKYSFENLNTQEKFLHLFVYLKIIFDLKKDSDIIHTFLSFLYTEFLPYLINQLSENKKIININFIKIIYKILQNILKKKQFKILNLVKIFIIKH